MPAASRRSQPLPLPSRRAGPRCTLPVHPPHPITRKCRHKAWIEHSPPGSAGFQPALPSPSRRPPDERTKKEECRLEAGAPSHSRSQVGAPGPGALFPFIPPHPITRKCRHKAWVEHSPAGSAGFQPALPSPSRPFPHEPTKKGECRLEAGTPLPQCVGITISPPLSVSGRTDALRSEPRVSPATHRVSPVVHQEPVSWHDIQCCLPYPADGYASQSTHHSSLDMPSPAR
jgi:hypothetical protein